MTLICMAMLTGCGTIVPDNKNDNQKAIQGRENAVEFAKEKIANNSDKKISAINFLQYSDDQWHLYAGNRYMYMNRLRHDDFLRLFESSGQQIVDAELDIDDRSQAVLRDGSLMLDNRFSRKSKNILSVVASWIVSNKRG